jgi:phosphatidylserine/phosphatidylglycerophosphate/cardiolipin synthase-like enzyme
MKGKKYLHGFIESDIKYNLSSRFSMKRSLHAILFFVFSVCLAPVAYSLEKEPISNYQVLFSPKDHIAEELIKLIQKEQKSIKAAVYCLMHRGIAKALIDAHERGVHVEVIIDPYSLKSRSPVKKMHEANVPLFIWNPSVPTTQAKNARKVKKHRPLMHDKFCILGNNLVWTGSFNFTFEGTQANRENVIVLENKEIASRYLEEFEHLKREGCQGFSEYSLQ